MTALMADSTPSTARTRESMPPSPISARTTTMTSGSRTRKRNGGSTRSPGCGVEEQRPAQHHQPGDGRDDEHGRGAGADRQGDGVRLRSGALEVLTARPPPRARQPLPRRPATGAPSTLVTCGANDGDSASTRCGEPLETTSPSAMHHDLVGDVRGELDVVGREQDRAPVGGEVGDDPGELGLAGVVEAAGGLVEQHDRRAGGEHDRQREREPLALGEVTRVDGLVDAGGEPVEQPAAGAGLGVGAAGRPRRTRRRRSRGRAGRRRSAAPARRAYAAAAGASAAGSSPITSRVPERRLPEPWSAQIRLDLPEPLRPIRTVTLPGDSVRSTLADGDVGAVDDGDARGRRAAVRLRRGHGDRRGRRQVRAATGRGAGRRGR